MKISEIITDKYKLRIPPTVYYELLADIREVEEDHPINGLDDFIAFGKKAFGVELTVKKSDNPDTYETTKNDLEVDLIDREKAIEGAWEIELAGLDNKKVVDMLKDLPSVTPQPCEDAVSRQAVLELIADYDLSMGQVVRGIHALPSVTPQEPFINKSCISSGVCEHDKQKVLDKIRAEVEIWHKEGTNWSDIRLMNIEDIIDKYKAEREDKE